MGHRDDQGAYCIVLFRFIDNIWLLQGTAPCSDEPRSLEVSGKENFQELPVPS
jgi:hypothetical protein